MKTAPTGILVFLLLASFFSASLARASASPNGVTTEPPASSILTPARVAVIVGNDTANSESLLQTRRLLDNKGLLYNVVVDADFTAAANGHPSLVIVLGSTQPHLDSSANLLTRCVQEGAGLIWIGSNLPESMYSLMGLSNSTASTSLADIAAIAYGDVSTQVFNETLTPISVDGAVVNGFFVDSSNSTVVPAEAFLKQPGCGPVYYFAYDVGAWWESDSSTPWLRAYRLSLAVDDALSEQFTMRLAPYPRNMQSVFITRIEDVDALHDSPEWLNRANSFLSYCSSRNAPLTVGLIPQYVDPALGLNISIGADTAATVRDWLSHVLLTGGTIVQHGDTHQYGDGKTGMVPEFFNGDTQQWLTYDQQKLRIQAGATLITQNLGFVPTGFEAPHYVANNDTYAALKALGFNYVTHNPNAPFMDQYGYDGLIDVPETLGYIPLNATDAVESGILSNMGMLYNMSGVMLYFNHLYEDKALQIGEDILNYVQTKPNVWIANAGNVAEFWAQRANAYAAMNVALNNSAVSVNLGPCNEAGLTLTLGNGAPIKSVTVNGQEWPTFGANFVILPALPKAANTVVISFDGGSTNANATLGYFATFASVLVCCVLVARTSRFKKPRKPLTGGR